LHFLYILYKKKYGAFEQASHTKQVM